MMAIPRIQGVISLAGSLLWLAGCSQMGTSPLQITIGNLSVVKQLCDPNLNSSYELEVTWRVSGGTPPITVWISYETFEGQPQTFGPFPWPEQNSFTLPIESYEGELFTVKASAQDGAGTRKEARHQILLRPCASLPPMKPFITIIPSGGSTIQEETTIEAKIINTLMTPIVAKSIVATGCAIKGTQPELPLLLGPAESKEVLVSLQCPKGGAAWKLRVLAGFTYGL